VSEREKEILNSIIEILKNHLNPDRIILFGSRAKNIFNQNADFDIAIDYEKVDIRKHRKIMEDIEKAAGLFKIDIVYLKNVDEEFKKIILNTGKIIYESRK